MTRLSLVGCTVLMTRKLRAGYDVKAYVIIYDVWARADKVTIKLYLPNALSPLNEFPCYSGTVLNRTKPGTRDACFAVGFPAWFSARSQVSCSILDVS